MPWRAASATVTKSTVPTSGTTQRQITVRATPAFAGMPRLSVRTMVAAPVPKSRFIGGPFLPLVGRPYARPIDGVKMLVGSLVEAAAGRRLRGALGFPCALPRRGARTPDLRL